MHSSHVHRILFSKLADPFGRSLRVLGPSTLLKFWREMELRFWTWQHPLPFDEGLWLEQTPTLPYDGGLLAPSMIENDHIWGLAQTFTIQSAVHNKKVFQAGEEWQTQIDLHSVDGWVPKQCLIYVAGTQYSVITQDTLPGANPIDKCELGNLGPSEWQIRASFQFPTSTRPDRYYVPLIILSDGESTRVAVPTIPSFIDVQNESAPPPLEVSELRVIGLGPAKSLGTLDLTRSYLANAGQEFQVEFDLLAPPIATEDLWFDLVSALKLKRFYLRTTDFSWAEVEMPDMHDSMIVSPAWGK